jgi:HEAT repeat protein
MQVGEGTLTDLRTYVGPVPARGNETPATDLGVVPAREAAAYFLQVAATASSRPSDRAILAAVLADSASVWRGLLAVARDTETRSHATRNNAAFWLSRFTAATAAGHPEDLAETDDEEEDDRSDTRTSAVFALSQLRDREGIAPLIQVARTNRDARVRKSALFWLGQSGDPRALALFEEILAR